MKIQHPYGTWASPISAEQVAKSARRFGQCQIDQGRIYWVETRPDEGGRSVLMCWDDGQIGDVVPKDFNVRSRVHEYGGVAYAVFGGVVFCSNGDDGRVYKIEKDQAPVAVTPNTHARYADFSISEGGEAVFCVRERHREGEEPINDIVCLQKGGMDVVATGNDFYAAPRLSKDGKKLSWLTWNHPHMPWDETELWVANWQNGQLDQARCLTGGNEEAIFQPTWGKDGHLYFVSDRTGWWNLYQWDGNKIVALWEKEAEFALPLWSLGMTTYAEATSGHWICAYIENGEAKLGHLTLPAQETQLLDMPYSEYNGIAAEGKWVVCIAGAWNQSLAVVRMNLENGQHEVVTQNERVVDSQVLSRPEILTYPSKNGENVHAFYYAPHHNNVEGLAGELPPLLIKSHGGPTGASTPTLDMGIQYWTSRGFAVLDVNYRGSTGYGRAYRRALDGQWGILDVQDCVSGAQYLAACNRVDENRLLIRGGSAGGLTTLCALAFYNIFRAGASYYGVSDLAALAKITHKFESQYLNRLLGDKDIEQTMKKRSPLFFAHQISAPVIFFQGTQDPVVPPEQTQTMADALKENNIQVACVMFDGEMHGFRQAKNIIYALKAEYAFYAAIFELDCNDDLVEIMCEIGM